MVPIVTADVQKAIEDRVGMDLYIHQETTNGSYQKNRVGAYIRNAIVRFNRGMIKGTGPYRVGLKMEHGWIYAEGLTHWELDEQGRLLLAGYDEEGKLTVALQLSPTPF